MRRNIIVIIALLVLAGWGIYDFNQTIEEPDENANPSQNPALMEIGIKKGNKAPDFELLNLEGQPVKLSDYAGKKVIVNFWATWCPPCRAEMPHMEKFYEKYGEQTVVLAVNLTHTEKNRSEVPAFVEEFGVSFPVVMDAKGDISGMYQIFAYPTSYVIDSQGIIQEIFRGAIDYDTMKRVVSTIK